MILNFCNQKPQKRAYERKYFLYLGKNQNTSNHSFYFIKKTNKVRVNSASKSAYMYIFSKTPSNIPFKIDIIFENWNLIASLVF